MIHRYRQLLHENRISIQSAKQNGTHVVKVFVNRLHFSPDYAQHKIPNTLSPTSLQRLNPFL